MKLDTFAGTLSPLHIYCYKVLFISILIGASLQVCLQQPLYGRLGTREGVEKWCFSR